MVVKIMEATKTTAVKYRIDQKGNLVSRRDGSIREVYYDYNNDVIEKKRNWSRRWREATFF